MLVLRAIGRFFKKIWDWIKQTAWIQPLLIVGLIFGVIFSIPSIVSGITAANQKRNAAEVYYMQFQLTLEGDENSPADKLLDAIMAEDTQTVKSIAGSDKFFLVFVNQENSGTGELTNLKGGFEVISSRLGDEQFKSDDGKSFCMKTIFTDQRTSSTTNEKSAFTQFLERNEDFFQRAGGAAYQTDFYGEKEEDTNLQNLIDIAEPFQTPTIMLIDMDPKSTYIGRGYEKGVNEIIFSVPGSDDYAKAEFLNHCWNHSKEFDRNDN